MQRRDCAAAGGVPADDGGDDVKELRRHGDDSFVIAFGWCDHQECDYFAAGAGVLANAQLGEFEEAFRGHRQLRMRLGAWSVQ